jgi:hypothetical protein
MRDSLSPDTPQAPALDLDALMARIRAEVEERKRKAVAEVAQSVNGAGIAANANAPRRADALLALPDAEFVREAYRAALGREPEQPELVALRDRLLTRSITRTGALKELLKTEEAKRRNARIDGLSTTMLRDSFQRSALARWFTQLRSTIRTVYLLPHRIRQLLKRIDMIERTGAETAQRTEELDRKLAGAKAASEAKAAAMERIAREALEATKTLAREVVRAREEIDASAGWAERRVDEAVRKANALEQDLIAALEVVRARDDATDRAIESLRQNLLGPGDLPQ